MKLSYRPQPGAGPVPPPTAPANDPTTTDAPAPTRPWLRRIGLGLTLVLLALGWWHWSTMERARGWGIVRGQIEEHRALQRSRLAGLYIREGDLVAPGDLLYVLIADTANADLDQLRNQLRSAEQDLHRLTARREALRLLTPSPSAAPPDQDALTRLRAELASLDRRADSQRHAQLRDIRSARDTLLLAQNRAHNANEAAESVQLLRRLDAATSVDERRARDRAQEAAIDVTLHRNRLAQAEAALASLTDEQHRRRQSLEERIENLRLHSEVDVAAQAASRRQEQADLDEQIRLQDQHLSDLRRQITHQEAQAGPQEHRAQAPGIVTELLLADGAHLRADEAICRIAKTTGTWIEGYIPSGPAGHLDPGTRIRITAEKDGHQLTGLLGSSDLEFPIPAPLRPLSEGFQRATRCRIDFDDPQLQPGNLVRLQIF